MGFRVDGLSQFRRPGGNFLPAGVCVLRVVRVRDGERRKDRQGSLRGDGGMEFGVGARGAGRPGICDFGLRISDWD